MELLTRKPTEDTPEVVLDAEEKIFRIAERSLPENAFEFYRPVYEWFENFMGQNPEKFELHIQLDYFNTASAKQLGKIFTLLESLKNIITVKWHYYDDDIDMYESGLRFSRLTDIEFEFIEEEPKDSSDEDFKIIYE